MASQQQFAPVSGGFTGNSFPQQPLTFAAPQFIQSHPSPQSFPQQHQTFSNQNSFPQSHQQQLPSSNQNQFSSSPQHPSFSQQQQFRQQLPPSQPALSRAQSLPTRPIDPLPQQQQLPSSQPTLSRAQSLPFPSSNQPQFSSPPQNFPSSNQPQFSSPPQNFPSSNQPQFSSPAQNFPLSNQNQFPSPPQNFPSSNQPQFSSPQNFPSSNQPQFSAMQQPLLSPISVVPLGQPSLPVVTDLEIGISTVYNPRGGTYSFTKQLGNGNFGVVFLCNDSFGQKFVIKRLKTNRPQSEVEADWKKELDLLFTMSHPNIIGIYDAFIYMNYYFMVMECASGDLRKYMSARKMLPEKEVIEIASQMLSGLNHIHSKDIIHRDLHIDNVLIKESLTISGEYQLQVKISDFGISKVLPKDSNMAFTFIGREYDYAPELLHSGHTTKQSDLYQVGLILYFCLTGFLAVSRDDGKAVADALLSGLAQQKAYALNTKFGNCLGILLNVNPANRFKSCIETWEAIAACKL